MFRKKKQNVPYLFTTKRRSRGKRRGNKEFNPKPFLIVLGCFAGIGALFFSLPKVYANPFKKVTIVDGYGEYTLLTKASTVGEIYKSGILNLKESDSTVSLDTPVNSGMTVYVDRSIVVNVISGGTNIKLRTKNGTAREILNQAGISFRETDSFNMSLDEPLKNGDTVVHAMIETKTVTKRVALNYDTVTVEDSTLEKGKTDVIFSGENGYKNVSYLITYQDGVEMARVIASEKVVKEPVSRKIAVGTMERVVSASSSGSGSSSVSSGSSGGSKGSGSSGGSKGSGSSGSSSYNKPSRPVNIIGSPKDLDPQRISGTKVMSVTAYTHTGNATATGVMPGYGTVAVDPKQIPLGTKLYIPGYGVGIAQDTGNMAPNTIDLFMDTNEECIKWGRKSLTIYILKY